MKFIQNIDQAVDITEWHRDEEYEVYPEGAREKTLVYCPSPAYYSFLEENRKYLFKKSARRYPEQYWMEIFAYYVGMQMGIDVPQTFVAYDSKKMEAGALIRWFLNSDDNWNSGGDYCQLYIPNFDRKKGKQHNFGSISQIFSDKAPNTDWKNYWATVFTFDALIGNTDRHQDNWGLIENTKSKEIKFCPAFDNGTSMGHEVIAKNFYLFSDNNYIQKYISKGTHHIKWQIDDDEHTEHCALLKKLVEKYPETQAIMLNCLKRVNSRFFKKILDHLTAFNVPAQLTTERASFMLKLLEFRYRRLLITLES